MLTFLIEKNTNNEEFQKICAENPEIDWSWVYTKQPFHEAIEIVYGDNYNLVARGSVNFVFGLKNRFLSHKPVAWGNLQDFSCSSTWPRYQEILFNDKYEIATAKQLMENKFDFYSKYAKDAMIFVRPDDGDKKFTGQLLDLQDFDRFWKNSVTNSVIDTDKIIVSTPKNIRSEWRFVVTNEEEIVAATCYQYQGKLTQAPGAPPKAKELVKKSFGLTKFPVSLYVVDVAEDDDNNFWILELNCVNCSGFYAADTKKIIDKMIQLAHN